jgi:hypothetical protein
MQETSVLELTAADAREREGYIYPDWQRESG